MTQNEFLQKAFLLRLNICLISTWRLPTEISLTEDVLSIYMILWGLHELHCPQGALLSWNCINQNWNFDVNGAESINWFTGVCDLHYPREHTIRVAQRSYHMLMLPGMVLLLLELVRTKVCVGSGNKLGASTGMWSLLFPSPGLVSLRRPEHYLGI